MNTTAATVTTEAEYRQLIRDTGPGFHPDTRAAEYTSIPDKYSPAEFDAIVDRAFDDENLDPYEIAYELLVQLLAELGVSLQTDEEANT